MAIFYLFYKVTLIPFCLWLQLSLLPSDYLLISRANANFDILPWGPVGWVHTPSPELWPGCCLKPPEDSEGKRTHTRTQRNRFIQLYVLTRDTQTVTASQKSNKHADLLNRFNKETDTQSQQSIIQLLLPLDTVITLQHDYKANYWTNSWVMMFQFNLGFWRITHF